MCLCECVKEKRPAYSRKYAIMAPFFYGSKGSGASLQIYMLAVCLRSRLWCLRPERKDQEEGKESKTKGKSASKTKANLTCGSLPEHSTRTHARTYARTQAFHNCAPADYKGPFHQHIQPVSSGRPSTGYRGPSRLPGLGVETPPHSIAPCRNPC